MNQTAVAAGCDSANAAFTASRRPPEGTELTVACYHNDVPAFIEADLQRLYSSIYSSLQQFQLCTDDNDVSTYILRENGQIVSVYLFRRQGEHVRVMNEVLRVGEEDMRRFAFYIFSNFPEVSLISFKAIRTDVRRLPYPFQRINHLEDYVLTLPSTVEEYHDRLGKGTRRNMKRHIAHLNERFADLRFEVQTEGGIDPQTITAIIAMNHARMAGKHKTSLIDVRESERIRALAKTCGMVGAVRINGRLCAGAISFRCGQDYYLNVIAHDPAYDEHWLGILCCYWTICECIARGGREFHFLWGRYDYKTMLRGELRDLDNVVIYRSRATLAAKAAFALRFALGGWRRQLQVRLHHVKRESSWLARCANALRHLASRNIAADVSDK